MLKSCPLEVFLNNSVHFSLLWSLCGQSLTVAYDDTKLFESLEEVLVSSPLPCHKFVGWRTVKIGNTFFVSKTHLWPHVWRMISMCLLQGYKLWWKKEQLLGDPALYPLVTLFQQISTVVQRENIWKYGWKYSQGEVVAWKTTSTGHTTLPVGTVRVWAVLEGYPLQKQTGQTHTDVHAREHLFLQTGFLETNRKQL